MQLFEIAQELLGGQAPGAGDMVGTVTQVLNNRAGGLDGVLKSLQNGGLGDAVGSWIGTGQNTSVTGAQVHSALGSGVIQELASKLGISTVDASSHLSQLLPGIIDHLTPNGEVPSVGLAGAGRDLVKGLLGRNVGTASS